MFKSNIRELMDKKTKTVRALRNDTGLSVTTIQRAVCDDTIGKCELNTLARIGSALGVKTKKLYEEVEGENPAGNE